MAAPFVGEIKMFGGNFAPQGWAICQGQLLAIAENDTLFSLIGTTYGGDGQNTFALPDLRSRVPMHQGTGPGLSPYVMGQSGGVENVTLNLNQIPQHTHTAGASNTGASDNAEGKYWANSAIGKPYGAPPAPVQLNALSIPVTGGSQPHDNMIPFQCVNYIIALFGIYPSPT